MKAKKVSTFILVGAARMLSIASDFLLHMTEKSIPEDRNNTIANNGGGLTEETEWPEEWARRISDSKNVTWFNFNAKQGIGFKQTKTIHVADNQVKKNLLPTPAKVFTEPSEPTQPDFRIEQDIEKKQASGKAETQNNTVELPRTFDSKKRLWVRPDLEKRKTHRSGSKDTDVNLPEKKKHDIPARTEPKHFFKKKVQKKVGSMVKEPVADIMVEDRISKNLPDEGLVHSWPRDDHALRTSPEIPSEVILQQDQINPVNKTKTSGKKNDLTLGGPSVTMEAVDEAPLFSRWPDTDETSSVSEEASKAYLIREPEVEFIESKNMFQNESGLEAKKPWPELENFTPHPEITDLEKSPENHDRILRLKQEQKGSLWSVLRF